MGALNTVLHSLNTGEVSASALARVDHERLRLAAEIQENLFPHAIGKAMVRPGTGYIGATASNAKARYLPFVRAADDTALIECTNALMRIWISDALLTRPSVTSTVANSAFSTASATVTISNASPGVITWTGHGIAADQPVAFTTTGALPTGLSASTTYYVRNVLSVDAFTVSATVGGAEINTSSAGSGTHTGYHGWTPTASSGSTVSMTGGVLRLYCTARGASCYAEQAVSTSNSGTEHALRITVSVGPVLIRVGSTSGGDDYIEETALGTGLHSLAFTPSGGTYYVRFINRDTRRLDVDGVTVESSGVVTLTAPWSESDLPLIRYAQSLDVIFLSCASWQQRKIERRGTTGRSWSLVKYETDDGPFATRPTNKVRVSSSAAYGVVTLTASQGIFTSDHVGSLFRLYPEGQNYTFDLAGEDTYTEPLRLSGISSANDWTFAITGTWAGTISRQHGFEGGDTGFITATTHVANASGSVATGTEFDNVIWYVRYGFEPSAYTSGVATINIVNTGGGAPGVFRILAYTSATQVTAQVLAPPGSLVSSDNWAFGAWSVAEGWPSAVALYDGRLVWGGADKFWASASDAYYSFDLDNVGDAGSIQRALATGGTINTVKWMLPLQRLIFGTDGAEVSARSSSFDEPLTPTNVTLKDASTHGAAAYSPAKMDGRGFYIHRDGLRLFELGYDVESNDYRAKSLMVLSDKIGGSGFVAAPAVQRSPETYVWTVRGNGDCPVLIYDVAEKVQGWFRFIAAASAAGAATVEDVVVLPSTSVDRVYLVVKRTINGSTVRYLEKLAKHSEAEGGTGSRMLDSYVYNAGPVTTFTGLTHFVGETVRAWGTYNGTTGRIGTTFTVNGSGEITLPGSCTNVTVGLSYDWRYKSAKLAYGAERGTALLMTKRIPRVGLVCENLHPDAISYGKDFTTVYKMPRIEGGEVISTSSIQTTYDEKTFPFGGSWDTDARLCLKGSAPLPATINAIVLQVETNEN